MTAGIGRIGAIAAVLGALACATASNNAYNQQYEKLKQQNAQQQLRWFADKMGPYPQATFDVQGFADSTGADLTNQMLSAQRSQACASYLQTLGIAPPRMQVTAFSTSSPAASNASSQGRKNNRRVEITVR